MVKFFCLILFCLSTFYLNAQKYTISGYVLDLKSGEAIVSANVYDLRTKQGTVTNNYGFYSLTLNSDTVELSISFIGYTSFFEKVYLSSSINKSVNLDPVLQLGEVVIVDKKSDEMVKSTQMSLIEMPINKIKSIPVIFGETDILKTLQLMPGVQSGSEGTSGMYVRGGGPDQNLILLDGVPVYNVTHLFGFFSVFNSDAISNVKLIKGGFPAQYGGRLSSVIDIRMKEGNMKEFHGNVGVGIISADITLEGPIVKDKTSFIFSGRRTYVDALSAPLLIMANKSSSSNKISAGYYFYDGNLKINHRFSDKDRLFLSIYAGRDKAYARNTYKDNLYIEKSNAELYWGNITTSLRWNHIFTSKIFANITTVYSNYIFNTEVENSQERNNIFNSKFKLGYFSGIEDVGAKIDFDYRPIPKHSIKFGFNHLYHIFKPGVSALKITGNGTDMNSKVGNNNTYANEFYTYVDDDWDITGFLKLNLGAHYSGFLVKGKFYNSLQPRISARFLINEKVSVKAAYSHMNQYIHLLTNSTIGLQTDLWLPSTDKVQPEKSKQIALGVAYNINNDWDLSLEGFYKTMNNLIEYKEGASFFQASQAWESKIEIGKGYSYGTELLIRKNFGKVSGWIGYTMSWSWRQFDNINFGKTFPYRYDRRHDISIVLQYELNDNIDFGLTWVYGTGNAVTLAIAKYEMLNLSDVGIDTNGMEVFNLDIEYYDNRNSYRMPAYHRLDLSFNFHKQKNMELEHGV